MNTFDCQDNRRTPFLYRYKRIWGVCRREGMFRFCGDSIWWSVLRKYWYKETKQPSVLFQFEQCNHARLIGGLLIIALPSIMIPLSTINKSSSWKTDNTVCVVPSELQVLQFSPKAMRYKNCTVPRIDIFQRSKYFVYELLTIYWDILSHDNRDK